jgi:hypothetical protein
MAWEIVTVSLARRKEAKQSGGALTDTLSRGICLRKQKQSHFERRDAVQMFCRMRTEPVPMRADVTV